MADNGIEWKWMAARFAGEINQENERLLNGWISASSYNARLYAEAVKIWETSKLKHLPETPDPETEWERLLERAAYEKEHFGLTVFTPFRMAAALLIILVSGAVIYNYLRDKGAQSITITAIDQVKTIYLPDSTKVWLNLNSEISYRNDFSPSKRGIELKGQAYFTVKSDSLHPFIIQSGNTFINVLGTSFDVKESDTLVQVIVEEGKVKLSQDDSEESIQLTHGQKGVSTKQTLTAQKNTNALFAAWRKKNNPIYANETTNPVSFLQTRFNYTKNSRNQTVIEGSIKNTATLAEYGDLVIKITYLRPNGNTATLSVALSDVARPGQRIFFSRSLKDYFTKDQQVQIEIENASVLE